MLLALEGTTEEWLLARSLRALELVSRDARSKAMLLEALEVEDSRIVKIAAIGLARRQDRKLVPLIEQAATRAGVSSDSELTTLLLAMEDDAGEWDDD